MSLGILEVEGEEYIFPEDGDSNILRNIENRYYIPIDMASYYRRLKCSDHTFSN
jgi:hypothetical protein